MRYKVSEFAPSGKRQYWIALGIKDLELLLEEARNAAAHTPLSDKDTRRRLRGIAQGLGEALAAAEEFGDTGHRRKVNVPAEPEKPKGYEQYLGGYRPVIYDGWCGEPIMWGWPINQHLGDELFKGIDTEYNRAEAQWYAVYKRLTPDEAVAKYGPITKLVTGPRGGFRRVTFGDKTFMHDQLRPDYDEVHESLIETER